MSDHASIWEAVSGLAEQVPDLSWHAVREYGKVIRGREGDTGSQLVLRSDILNRWQNDRLFRLGKKVILLGSR